MGSKKFWTVVDGIGTAHTSREGKTVDFRPGKIYSIDSLVAGCYPDTQVEVEVHAGGSEPPPKSCRIELWYLPAKGIDGSSIVSSESELDGRLKIPVWVTGNNVVDVGGGKEDVVTTYEGWFCEHTLVVTARVRRFSREHLLKVGKRNKKDWEEREAKWSLIQQRIKGMTAMEFAIAAMMTAGDFGRLKRTERRAFLAMDKIVGRVNEEGVFISYEWKEEMRKKLLEEETSIKKVLKEKALNERTLFSVCLPAHLLKEVADGTPAEKEEKTSHYYMALPYTYEVVPDRDGYVVSVKELPGCLSQGSTPSEAIERVREAMELWIDACLANGQQVPMPEKKEV